MIPPMPKIPAARSIPAHWDAAVLIQEKIDGSQISFMRTEDQLFVKTRSRFIDEKTTGEFALAYGEIKDRFSLMRPNVVYRGEFLRAPKHNRLRYGRVPKGHIVLFALDDSGSPAPQEARYLGFEPVPAKYVLNSTTVDPLKVFPESCLGGPIEGVVVRRADTQEAVKIVTPEFLEASSKATRPLHKALEHQLADVLCTETRIWKAYHRERDAGTLVGDRSDIGRLVKALVQDVKEEIDQPENVRLILNTITKGVLSEVAQKVKPWYDYTEGGRE